VSILVYIEEKNIIALCKTPSKKIVEIARWPAHNNVASTSEGVWKKGVYRWSHYNLHPEAGLMPASLNTAYGGTGIHVFIVPGRSGMGVHAGRSMDPSRAGGKTLGCIRTSTEAMLKINAVHAEDPLSHIAVARGYTLAAHTSGLGATSWANAVDV
jgi:hypothetical protein